MYLCVHLYTYIYIIYTEKNELLHDSRSNIHTPWACTRCRFHWAGSFFGFFFRLLFKTSSFLQRRNTHTHTKKEKKCNKGKRNTKKKKRADDSTYTKLYCCSQSSNISAVVYSIHCYHRRHRDEGLFYIMCVIGQFVIVLNKCYVHGGFECKKAERSVFIYPCESR